jgi:hypothetical protein
MSLFVEVESVDKGCKVIINLEHVVEITPFKETAGGGCSLAFADGNGGRSSLRIKDSYAVFKQFAMQTVSGDMIKDRISKINASIPDEMKSPVAIEKAKSPKKGTMMTTADLGFDIPKL